MRMGRSTFGRSEELLAWDGTRIGVARTRLERLFVTNDFSSLRNCRL